MKNNTAETGSKGEEYAAAYLRKRRYRILGRNFRTKYGEIDIIAAKGSYTVFVEVKTRHENSLTMPFEAVDLRKQRRIITTAAIYCKEKGLYDKPLRFDVIEVYVDRQSLKCLSVNHIENAFESKTDYGFL